LDEDHQEHRRAHAGPPGRSPFGAAIDTALMVMDGVHTLVWSRGNGHKDG
jgi:hypothetical protein